MRTPIPTPGRLDREASLPGKGLPGRPHLSPFICRVQSVAFRRLCSVLSAAGLVYFSRLSQRLADSLETGLVLVFAPPLMIDGACVLVSVARPVLVEPV